MPDWGSLLDFCAAYYATQLVRCAAFSFLLLGLVMLLRKMLFSRRTFIRGLLWSSFLLIPFLGKLKLFYENKAVVRITGRIISKERTGGGLNKGAISSAPLFSTLSVFPN